jgi:adenylosuccinate synthase
MEASDGKGAISAALASEYDVHVRVGAANAGHTVWVDGEKHVLQQIPCAAYTNPHAECVVGRGALISLEIMLEEIQRNRQWRIQQGLPPLDLFIDGAAHVIDSRHITQESQSGLAERIGSTSAVAREGIGAAQIARVARDKDGLDTIGSIVRRSESWADEIAITDTVELLDLWREVGSDILLEGTQGTGLDLVQGDWPYVTSRSTTAAGLCADTGIGPRYLDKVILVCRTFPIRVAGNSGPFYHDSDEIDFETIGVDPEHTTVTKLRRRIATLSYEQIRRAVLINSATDIALTFCDYVDPGIAGQSGDAGDVSHRYVLDKLVYHIESIAGVPVSYMGTGPSTVLRRNG